MSHFFDTDNESDTEVPYADIMITVRGVSTPELTQVCYLTPGDQKEVRDSLYVCNINSYSPFFYVQLFATPNHIYESKADKSIYVTAITYSSLLLLYKEA